MPSVCTFARLPDEEPEFLRYLQRTGDVWARASDDDPDNPNCQPMPVADFLYRFATEIQAHSVVRVYIGFKADVLNPQIRELEVTEGATLEPEMQNGEVFSGVQKIVGGTKGLRRHVHSSASHLIAYSRGEFREPQELATSNLSFYSGAYINHRYINHPKAFMKWASNVLQWMRRHTPKSVPVYNANYEVRASVAVHQECQRGLRVR
jgi:hypothetical protein